MGNRAVQWLSAISSSSNEAAHDILIMDFTIVTACLIGKPERNSDKWVLVDTGLENSDKFILKCTDQRFGKNSRPQAIILTHGHFDHVGSVKKLSELWNVPVYAHPLEIPYITGKKDYPMGNPDTDKGMVAKMSSTFPHTSIDISFRAVEFPADGSVPGMSEWKWIHTPGHTIGHISLFRERDRVLIAGDAFSTTKQESLWSVLTHDEQISGPPKYLTEDWQDAEESVNRLLELKPSLAITSHGKPLRGEEVISHLQMLSENFNNIAKPEANA